MQRHLFTILICDLFAERAAAEIAIAPPTAIPIPEGLQQCPPDDPVGAAESRVAKKIGGEYLGCFQSARRMALPGVVASAQISVEVAFAILLHGNEYKATDLANLVLSVKSQWKDFDPLSKQFKKNYIKELNDIIATSGKPASETVVSVKPILISIDETEPNYYTVTSIRSYEVDVAGRSIKLTNVNSDAVALLGTRLIRLTIQRVMNDPQDVAQVRKEINAWAHATTLTVERLPH